MPLLLSLPAIPPAKADFSSEGVATGVVTPDCSVSSGLMVEVEVERPLSELFSGPRCVSLNSATCQSLVADRSG